ncbi:alpha-protein kinase vwkA-like [Clytia hemisphaerica]|uniref:alpha-protein kinase vwkA-like n=1 Tax=Clytia hemisphaerica TaxID=252671 RepID=UPI0034D57475
MTMEEQPFGHGGFRDVFKAFSCNKLYGDYVVKTFQKEKIDVLKERLFTEEEHARKTVQMHALAQYLSVKFKQVIPKDFGESFVYTTLYFGKFNDGNGDQYVTVERFLEGEFEKFVNNDGNINHAPELDKTLLKKAETFAHYTYLESRKSLMVVDLQGVKYTLSDPEIASQNSHDSTDKMYFCTGNWGHEAIQKFLKVHKCNSWCKQIGKRFGE